MWHGIMPCSLAATGRRAATPAAAATTAATTAGLLATGLAGLAAGNCWCGHLVERARELGEGVY